jgi:hypothetical protein
VTWQLILQQPPAKVEIGLTPVYCVYLTTNFIGFGVGCGVVGLVVGLILGAILDVLVSKR